MGATKGSHNRRGIDVPRKDSDRVGLILERSDVIRLSIRRDADDISSRWKDRRHIGTRKDDEGRYPWRERKG